MKVIMILLGFLLCSTAYAEEYKLADCEVVEVLDSSYLEESLSVEEYPDVKIIKNEPGSKLAWLGSSLYRELDGHRIEETMKVGFESGYIIYPFHGLEEYSVFVTEAPRKGELLGRIRKSQNTKYGPWVLIATLKCK